MAWSAVIGAWLAGLLGGAHCLAMCGGFVTALSGAARPHVAPLRSRRALVWGQLPYNLGRVTTYATLGALAGGAGAAVVGAAQWLPVQRGLFVAANLALLAVAWVLISRREALAGLQAVGARVFGGVSPIVRPLMARHGSGARYALGMLWGLVPCGMTYSLLPVALFAGGWWQGATVMLAFGLGTLPNLMAAGWLVARGRRWLDRRSVRLAAAGLLTVFAAIGIWRAFGDPAMLSRGPFCLVS